MGPNAIAPRVVPVSQLVVVAPSPIHGMGAFATNHIPAHTRVIEYIGDKIDKSESIRRCAAGNEYIFSLNETEDLDGNVSWNPARVLNHSCAPNCEAQIEGGHIWLVSLREIVSGEELTFNYGYDLEDYQNYPCACGTLECVGYIVAADFFEHVLKNRSSREACRVPHGDEALIE
jgi:SET domain-containing protein